MHVNIKSDYSSYEEKDKYNNIQTQIHGVNTATFEMNEQTLNIFWDDDRNTFKILTDGKMSVFPSSANGILIKDEH
ncbi:MAG: hypothetical protein J6X18_00730 [Bacteroidales bacterium]|nr:hypothetical protein [Bacteroidales bacterium]